MIYDHVSWLVYMCILYGSSIQCCDCEQIDLLVTSVVFVRTAVRSTTRSRATYLLIRRGAYGYPNLSDQEWERNLKVRPWLCLVHLWQRYVVVGSVLIVLSVQLLFVSG